MLHLADVCDNSNIEISCNDTDIMIILLGIIEKFATKCIWIQTGSVYNNTSRYINVNLIAENLGSQVCKALPALHAFTGCDYSPAFFGKGKKKPLKLVLDDDDLQHTLSDLGENENIDDGLIKKMEKFTCLIYGKKKCSSIDEALDSFYKRIQT